MSNKIGDGMRYDACQYFPDGQDQFSRIALDGIYIEKDNKFSAGY